MTKKFRIWDGQKFFYAKEKPYLDSAYNSLVFRIEGETIWGNEGGITIQQYTGLTDSQGAEIYEGDILKFSNLNYEVMWIDWQWIATCPNYIRHNWPKFENFGREARMSKVVGNNFQTPELLEKS